MATRLVLAAALLLALAACSGDADQDTGPGAGPHQTSDADCAARIPGGVFETLGWSDPKAAEATVRGCHRESDEGYVEVRDRIGYDRLCATLDRSGKVGPGTPVDWLSGPVTACAVEPAGPVGQTKVVVQGQGRAAVQITVAVLTGTPRAKVRAAVSQLLG